VGKTKFIQPLHSIFYGCIIQKKVVADSTLTIPVSSKTQHFFLWTFRQKLMEKNGTARIAILIGIKARQSRFDPSCELELETVAFA
jgi:hypothetical protein